MTESGAADDAFNPAALDMLRRLGKGQLLVRMIDIFLAKTPERIEAARTALRTDDMPALELAVHSMKSSAAQLGGAQLQRTAAAAEHAVPTGDRGALAVYLDAIETQFAELRIWLEQEKADALDEEGDQSV